MVFICPIIGVSLSGHPEKQIKVDRVTFIDRAHFFKNPPLAAKSEFFNLLETDQIYSEALKDISTVAILHQNGDPNEVGNTCFRHIKEELDILSASRLGIQRRRYAGYIGIGGEHATAQITNFVIGDKGELHYHGQINRLPFALSLDSSWIKASNDHAFFALLEIIRGSSKVSSGWRATLRRVAILLGKSANTSDIALAFLWNMIAFETLLTQQGDSYSNALPKRAKAFIGFVGAWQQGNWAERIESLYKIRCQFVHDGNTENISIHDVLFMDHVCRNIFENILRSIELFPNKDAAILFAEKVSAQALLEIKDTLRPASFMYYEPAYTDEDFRRI